MPVDRIGFMLMVFHSTLAYVFPFLYVQIPTEIHIETLCTLHSDIQNYVHIQHLKFMSVFDFYKPCYIRKLGTSVWEENLVAPME